MATAIKVALVETGIKAKPQIQLIWQWLKDAKQAHTAKEIATALGMTVANTSSTLGMLCGRDMASGKQKWNEHSQREVTYYVTNQKLKTYELQPFTQAYKNRPKRNTPMETVEPIKSLFPVAGTANKTPLTLIPEGVMVNPVVEQKSLLDTLSVREAYSLYLELFAMFNPKKEIE